jgi:ribonucleoside-diphosphate reductase alpha chain
LQNVDNANQHSSFDETVAPIRQSNLCAEIDLPTKPLTHIFDEEGRIALCTLSAINWGNIKSPADFEKPCMLAVRGLDALLSYQNYPVRAAEIATEEHRPLGVGIINFAYFLAKNDLKYSDDTALTKVDEYAEAWSYYLIKASADLAVEQGTCGRPQDTKYAKGIVPIDTRKRDIDELIPHVERMPWDELRAQLKETGIRNATLMALMPAETSAQIANATNGIEPPRSLISVKQSKHGVLKQVVPEFRKLKNKYELLWDQKSPEGYLKICAVLQKYIDQGISVNTSYNPQFYPDEKIPMSELLKHMLLFYKFGGKQLYYNNTYDGQGEVNIDKLSSVMVELPKIEEEDCESCKI